MKQKGRALVLALGLRREPMNRRKPAETCIYRCRPFFAAHGTFPSSSSRTCHDRVQAHRYVGLVAPYERAAFGKVIANAVVARRLTLYLVPANGFLFGHIST